METDSTNSPSQRIALFFATFFYVGRLPIPGTIGTLGAVALYYLISDFSLLAYSLFLPGFIIFSVWAAGEAEKSLGRVDPQQIVIDEVCGYLVTMLLVPPTLTNIIIGFVLFRLFDILKPPPIAKLERLHGGFGIVMDDVLAGVYANIVLEVAVRIIERF